MMKFWNSRAWNRLLNAIDLWLTVLITELLYPISRRTPWNAVLRMNLCRKRSRNYCASDSRRRRRLQRSTRASETCSLAVDFAAYYFSVGQRVRVVGPDASFNPTIYRVLSTTNTTLTLSSPLRGWALARFSIQQKLWGWRHQAYGGSSWLLMGVSSCGRILQVLSREKWLGLQVKSGS